MNNSYLITNNSFWSRWVCSRDRIQSTSLYGNRIRNTTTLSTNTKQWRPDIFNNSNTCLMPTVNTAETASASKFSKWNRIKDHLSILMIDWTISSKYARKKDSLLKLIRHTWPKWRNTNKTRKCITVHSQTIRVNPSKEHKCLECSK